MQSSPAWKFWVDRGGTFTDIVARAPDGMFETYKLLSENPEHYQDAAVYGIYQILGLSATASIPPGSIEEIKMGTTVATNALLERQGERTLLVITKGFKDLLRIGYQNRPRLFDLNVRLPELLYAGVIEAKERLSHDGKIIQALDQQDIGLELEKQYNKGFRSVAVALLHGYRFHDHEWRIGAIAKEIGFTQVSLSHQSSPLIRLISRGDTTVVDAYLSPVLNKYVKRMQASLGSNHLACKSLLFMKSNGGLTASSLFQGKDAILSGPAGGVVGMVKTALQLGKSKIIGFDMGGTSTDVCHYAGELERSFETEVAGVRMRAPMMSIHTVAAGGGSILTFRDGRMQVGPESAGANPGPSSYRRGGPLTVTDCNVVLGKLQPQHFPKVFGPNANESLDGEIVYEKFKALSHLIAKQSGSACRSPEALAQGFLKIAVENMANAIKKISVQRGYNVTAYTMNCFGGAGGQHACLVADVLGMTSIFIHPFAGVLSAFGMGLADIRAMREYQFDKSIVQTDDAATILDDLSHSATDELIQQSILPTHITLIKTAHIRTLGAHQTLPIPFGSQNTMRESFDTAHHQRYGYIPEYQDLIIELLSCEAIGQTGESAAITLPTLASSSTHTIKANSVKMFCDGQWHTVQQFDRETLPLGMKVNGPAIIQESTGTNIIESGWQAEVIENGTLHLQRLVPLKRGVAVGTSVDPVMLEVFNNLFMSIAEQMGATLENTSYSVNIKERLDFSCALFSPHGDLIANAPHVPVHLGSMSECIRFILAQNVDNIHPGDVFMHNNPFSGGTHLPDITVITPVFDAAGKNIMCIVASRGHHADIGGKTPGSSPSDSTHIEEEGLLITNFKLVDRGVFQEEKTRQLFGSTPYPCRNIDNNMMDLAAQIAANATGERALQSAVQQYGLDVIHAYMKHIQDNAEESVRGVLAVLKSSQFSYPLDSGACIKVKIAVDNQHRMAVIDFTGTSDQDRFNYNAPRAITNAVVLYVFRTLVDSNIPMNEGFLKPFHIIVPQGSMLNPDFPAAVIAGNTEVSQAIADTLYGALGVIAGSQGTMNNFVYGNERCQNYETICGGMGAGSSFDGADAIQSHMTNTKMADPEVLENRFPILVESFEIRKHSGGKGQYQGGEGVIRKVRFLESMTVTVLSSHRQVPPHGVAGGKEGSIGENAVIRSDGTHVPLQGNDEIQVHVNDQFIIKTPGGGGYGKPTSS